MSLSPEPLVVIVEDEPELARLMASYGGVKRLVHSPFV
jgi:hypothetical protein